MIKLSIEAIDEIIASIANDEDILDNEAVADHNVIDVRTGMTNTNDEAFVRLALEQTLKDNRPEDYARFSNRFEEELEPVFLDLYQKLWGALPDGPAPKVDFIRCWAPKAGEISSYRRADWFKIREDLYGPPPYDYSELRKIALEPA